MISTLKTGQREQCCKKNGRTGERNRNQDTGKHRGQRVEEIIKTNQWVVTVRIHKVNNRNKSTHV